MTKQAAGRAIDRGVLTAEVGANGRRYIRRPKLEVIANARDARRWATSYTVRVGLRAAAPEVARLASVTPTSRDTTGTLPRAPA